MIYWAVEVIWIFLAGGTGRGDGRESKVLQEVLADLKSVAVTSLTGLKFDYFHMSERIHINRCTCCEHFFCLIFTTFTFSFLISGRFQQVVLIFFDVRVKRGQIAN